MRTIRRREFIAGLAGAAAWPPAARAQQDDRVQALQIRIMRLQAEAAADKISTFIGEIEAQVRWTTQLSLTDSTLEARKFDALRLLRAVVPITDFAQLDSTGKEQLRVNRREGTVVASKRDFSQDPIFTVAVAKGVYFGPVYLDRGPRMMVSLAGTRGASVSIVEIGLELIWDIVQMKVGEHGVTYILDAQGRVIAHPDFSLFQRDFSSLAQVQAARAAGPSVATTPAEVAQDIHGREVLTTSAAVRQQLRKGEFIAPLGWLVFVELPVEEASALAQ